MSRPAMLPLALKYVMFRHHTEDALDVRFCVAPTTHKHLANELASTHAPISAGFVEFMSDGTARAFGCSTSLCLAPAAEDSRFITAMLRATHRTAPKSDPVPV